MLLSNFNRNRFHLVNLCLLITNLQSEFRNSQPFVLVFEFEYEIGSSVKLAEPPSGSSLSVSKSFLTGRRQRVEVGDCFSSFLPVTSAVPQDGVCHG